MAERTLISTGSPFEKVAGYSRAVKVGNMVYVAVTTGYDYTTMTLPEDVVDQAKNCMETIKKALETMEAAATVRRRIRSRRPRQRVAAARPMENRPRRLVAAAGLTGMTQPGKRIPLEMFFS